MKTNDPKAHADKVEKGKPHDPKKHKSACQGGGVPHAQDDDSDSDASESNEDNQDYGGD